jgi:type 2 lantibiotic biosynthesis protein LanM
MKELDAIAVEKHDELWEAPEWYRALSLTERLARTAASPTPGPPAATELVERAQARLRAWKAQRPFAQELLFAERLAADALSEADLVSLLAEPSDRLKARVADVPEWLAALRDAFAPSRGDDELWPLLEDVERDHPLAACLPALEPLLRRGLSAVEETVEALRERHGVLPFDPEAIPRIFLANIASAVLFQVSKPLILEMHIARLRGRLQGESGEARFADFARRLRQEGLMVSLLAKYPVLARQLLLTVEQWAEYLGEFLTHLCADWDALSTTFAVYARPGLLVDVDAGRGDPHRRGRTVLLLHFESGLRLVYKPKPLAVDVHFQELLSWLNERGAEPPFRPLELLDRGDHGWSEFVAPAPCASEDEVTRFYERHGAYLALLHALDGADFHNENLIAAGEHPMLVDLEALFHPHVYRDDPMLVGNAAAGALDQSVWRVGLLPRRVWSDDVSVGVDMSGLGGQPGQMNPHPVVGWDGTASDELRVHRRRVELPASENRPRLRDHDVDAVAYTDSIVAGFRRMYRLLVRHRDALLSEQLPRFARDTIRVVARSTNVYGLLLYESFHPDLLRDALDRDRFFDRLWGEAAHHRYLVRLVGAEKRDLWRRDIPLFTTSPDSRVVFTSDGESLTDFLRAPSLEVVRRRVEELDEDDLAKQVWIIEASLATLLMDRKPAVGPRVRVPEPAPRVTRDRLLARAATVGERLEQLALQHDGAAYWLGVGPLDDSAYAVYPTGADLYAGAAGMSLFLAYLGAITADRGHTLLAERALAAVRAQVRARGDAHPDDPDGALSLSVGAFEGIGSIIYLLTNLGVLWRGADLLDEAEQLVRRLPPLIARDERLDVIYGSAGCILALLALHAVRPSRRTMHAAVCCGERLVATAQRMPRGIAWTTLSGQPPLGGFSHGSAGIAFALLRLANRSGERRFREAALEALKFDRTLFVPELHNWADLRVFPPNNPDPTSDGDPGRDRSQTSMVAWCHGAPGIGLGRLAALDELDDSQVREEIDIALGATTEYGFDVNHSLCHGALGNVDFLLVAADVLGRREDHEELERAVAAVVGSIEANGPVSGVPLGVETPGFMTGLAGIGYELLRVAEPHKVPSALVLAPPAWEADGRGAA